MGLLVRTRVRAFVLVCLLGALVAGAGQFTLSQSGREFSSRATVVVTPLQGTGDPDRVIATQVAVLQSRSLQSQVTSAQGGSTSYLVQASQVRMSNIISIVGTSQDPDLAVSAAQATASLYVQSVPLQSPAVAVAELLDPAGPAQATGSVARETVLAAAAGAVLAAALLLALVTARPRIRSRYVVSPVGALLLELPGRRKPAVEAEAATALVRLVSHMRSTPGAPVSLSLSALPSVHEADLRWVAGVLSTEDPVLVSGRAPDGGALLDVSQSTVPSSSSPRASVAIVVARSWMDSEFDLRRSVAARALFTDVLVVVLGSRAVNVVPPRTPDPAFVAPAREQRRAVDDGQAPVW